MKFNENNKLVLNENLDRLLIKKRGIVNSIQILSGDGQKSQLFSSLFRKIHKFT